MDDVQIRYNRPRHKQRLYTRKLIHRDKARRAEDAKLDEQSVFRPSRSQREKEGEMRRMTEGIDLERHDAI